MAEIGRHVIYKLNCCFCFLYSIALPFTQNVMLVCCFSVLNQPMAILAAIRNNFSIINRFRLVLKKCTGCNDLRKTTKLQNHGKRDDLFWFFH